MKNTRSDQMENPIFWYDYIQGSLAEERRQPSPNRAKSYNRKVSKARRRYKVSDLTLGLLLSNLSDFTIKLSLLEGECPDLTISIKLNIQELCKSNMSLLRSFLIWYYQQQVPPWVKYLIEEDLDRILNLETLKGKRARECYIIRKIFLSSKELAMSYLEEIYSEHNLQRWYETGKSLGLSYRIVKIPIYKLKEKVRRRGHPHSSSNKQNSKDERRKVMETKEARTFYQIRQDIIRKQALLFEKRLDEYLMLEGLDAEDKKKEISNLIEEDFSKVDPIHVNNVAFSGGKRDEFGNLKE